MTEQRRRQRDAVGTALRSWSSLLGRHMGGLCGLGHPVYEHVLDRARVGEGTRVLDCGCGAGRLRAWQLSAAPSVSGIDASTELVEIAAARVPGGRVLDRRHRSPPLGRRRVRRRDRVQRLPVRGRQGPSTARGGTCRPIAGRDRDTGAGGRIGHRRGLQAGLPALRRPGAGEPERERDLRTLEPGLLDGTVAAAGLTPRSRTTRSTVRSCSPTSRRRSGRSWAQARCGSRSPSPAKTQLPRQSGTGSSRT